jgi:DNA-binding MarR family transcriptional regulator
MVSELTKQNYAALAEFRFQIRHFLHFSELRARGAGIEPQQYQLLLALAGMAEDAEPTVGYLAERLLVKHHSAVELVDRLERLGFVQRATNPKDRRGVLVSLTEAGAQVLDELSTSHREELDRTGPKLAEALRRIMRRSRTGGESAA